MANVFSRWKMRHLTEEEVEEILTEGRVARVCCHNPDGSIHATPVWFLYDEGVIKIPVFRQSQKAKNLQRNNTVTVLVDLVRPARGVIVYGHAELETGDVINQTIAINNKYLKDKAKAKAMVEEFFKDTDYLITIKPDKIVSFIQII